LFRRRTGLPMMADEVFVVLDAAKGSPRPSGRAAAS
jgi:hypothetical protein